MPKGKDQLFVDFGHFVVTQDHGAIYQRDPRQSVPPDCGFIRFRSPGSGLFNAAGIIKFRQRDDGVKACQAFVAASAEPLEVQMNFPSETPRNFASPTFAAAHAEAQSRWRRWKRAVCAPGGPHAVHYSSSELTLLSNEQGGNVDAPCSVVFRDVPWLYIASLCFPDLACGKVMRRRNPTPGV